MDKTTRNRSFEVVILGSLLGAAVGAGAALLASKPDTRRKTFRLWDEIKDETINWVGHVWQKSRMVLREERPMLSEGKKRMEKEEE